ncbi:ferredoxin [Maridesulfovibrio bastinii]|uniref:ferredoxin n=1 Tax=Maridesulfovibrio bastinii TaxID=47157 RepID=UPI0003F787A3|nr:ferredoxin [Maridesulfovibrio bastinii]
MARQVVIDTDECIGCEACVETCPNVFSMGPGGFAMVVNSEGASEEEINEAIDMCPANCISFED